MSNTIFKSDIIYCENWWTKRSIFTAVLKKTYAQWLIIL